MCLLESQSEQQLPILPVSQPKTSYQVERGLALLVCLLPVRTNRIGFRRPASAANRRAHSKGAIGPCKAMHQFSSAGSLQSYEHLKILAKDSS